MLFFVANASALTGRGNNTWLLDGAEPALIDAGLGDRAHLDAIARALGGRPLARVLVTHGHPDHASRRSGDSGALAVVRGDEVSAAGGVGLDAAR